MVNTNEMQSRISQRQRYSVCGAGVLLTIGASLLLYWPWIFRTIIDLSMTLKPNSLTFDLWKVNPMPIYLDFYMFNWTNPQDIYDPNTKPHFVEIGPFRFKEIKKKVNITWNSNGTVSFHHMKTWWFDEENSVGGIDINITTINPVSVSGAYQARNWGFWMKKGFQFSLGQIAPRLPITKTVGEFIFYGYDDIFVKMSNKIPMPGLPDMDKFGWFYLRNNSFAAEGYYNMDITSEKSGQLKMWNTLNKTGSYTGTCAEIRGSAGELYLRDLKRTNISFFSSDICRQVVLDYDEDEQYRGFDGYKFAASTSFLDNGTLRPENACYCNGECIPSGMLNVSKCKYGAPGFISLPHFYKADPYYLDQVEGLTPNKSVHDMYIVLEPNTGIPISVAARLQLNLLVQPVQYVTLFEGIPKLYFPVLWFEQTAALPEYLEIPFKILLNMPSICQVLGYIFVVLSTSIITYIIYKPIYHIIIPKLEKHIILARELTPLDPSIEEPLERVDIKSDKLLM